MGEFIIVNNYCMSNSNHLNLPLKFPIYHLLHHLSFTEYQYKVKSLKFVQKTLLIVLAWHWLFFQRVDVHDRGC